MRTITKRILVVCGVLSVGLGVLGMFLPLLPTTPFLLLAALCFAKSSQKAYIWLLTNRWCGGYIRNYQENKGISLKHKILSLSILWVTIGYSAVFVVEQLWLKLLLFAIAAGVSAHILSMNTCSNNATEIVPDSNVVLNHIKNTTVQEENK